MVRSDPYSLQFVSDIFVSLQQLKIWHDDNDYCYDDEFVEWYDGYEKRKAQKVKTKEEILAIA